MSKLSALLLALLICLALAQPAQAADHSRSFHFLLTADNQSGAASVAVGEALTVRLVVQRLDSQEDYAAYAIQDEIIYDSRYFELVAGSVRLQAPEFYSAQRDLSDHIHKKQQFYLGQVPKTGLNCTATLEVGSFQLRALQPTPSGQPSAITQSGYAMGTSDGLDRYLASAADLSITVKAAEHPKPDPGPSGGGGGGGGGGSSTPSTAEETQPQVQVPEAEQTAQITEPQTPLTGPRFADMPPSHWAFAQVEYLAERGFVTGKSTALFAPEAAISRAEFVTILARLSGENLPAAGNAFADVPAGAYYAQAVAWAVAAQVTNGTGTASFSPQLRISRQEIAAMLSRYASYRQYRFDQTQARQDFTDQAEIHAYAREAVSVIQQAGIINGYPDGSFRPLATANRAEAAKMLALLHALMNP